MARPAIDRFLEKIVFSDETDCILWGASLDSNGYGWFWADGRMNRAHRWLWEYLNGAVVPDEMNLDHVRAWGCSHKNCVNPAHLEVVTPVENTMRGDCPPAENARKDRCHRGHEFTEANTYLMPGGGRRCVTCQADLRREYGRRHRASQPVPFCSLPTCSNRIPEGARSDARYCSTRCRNASRFTRSAAA